VRAALFALAACGSASPPPPIANQAPSPAVSESDGLRIVFERQACHGRCSEYRFEISPDHTVVWHGITNVKTMGEAHGTIDDRQLDKIRIALELANFDARDEFGALPRDTSWDHCDDVVYVKIAVTRRGVAHTIYHHMRCNPDDGLDQLEATLDEVAGTAAWK